MIGLSLGLGGRMTGKRSKNYPTIFFNGVDITGSSGFDSGVPGTNPGQWVPDYLGNLVNAGVDVPAMQGMRLDGSIWVDTKLDGTPIIPSTLQPTRTFDAGFVTSTPGPTFPRYIRANPATDMPGYLSEPARSTFAKLPAAPATQTTASLALGTYCLWVEGTGSFQASAGTAAATGGFGAAAVAGSPVTFTITTAGTVVLTKSGTVTWVQLELGGFPTSRIDNPLSVSSVVRAGTILSYPTLGKIRPNNQAYLLTVVPRASGQTAYLWSMYTNSSNFSFIQITPTEIRYENVVGGFKVGGCRVPYTHTSGTAFEVMLAKSSAGIYIAVRKAGDWTNGGVSVSTANAMVSTNYQLGSLNNLNQFCGNISEFETLDIPVSISDVLQWCKTQFSKPLASVNDPSIFSFTYTGLTLLDGVLRTTSDKSVTINWGDGSSNTYSGTSDTAFTHTYAGATVVYNVKITAVDDSVLTKLSFTDRAGGKVGGTLSLPSGMTYFGCTGSNTLSGTLSLPSGMTYFGCTGSNTLSGTLSIPSGMTYFVCTGSNTLGGTLSLPSGMTTFVCQGSNNLSGTLSLPSGMTTFGCQGSNTLSGTLSLPFGMTIFGCTGSNTLSGTLSLPSGMTYFSCTGSNNLSGYTPSTKASNQQRFALTGLNTLTSSMVDNIINDYAAAGGTWAGEKVFSLTVLTASNRTSASDAGWTTLGTKGLVTQTITLR